MDTYIRISTDVEANELYYHLIETEDIKEVIEKADFALFGLNTCLST